MKNTIYSLFFFFHFVSAHAQPVVCGHMSSFSYEFAYSIAPTSDNGSIIAGLTYEYSISQQDDAYLVKLDSNHNLMWGKTFSNGIKTEFFDVEQTTDGGYIATGYCQSAIDGNNILIVKTDSAGTLEWSRVVGDTGADIGYVAKQTPDGGYAVTGYINGSTLILIKLSAPGNILWVRNVDPPGKLSLGLNLAVTPDSGFVVCGYISHPADPNGYVVRFTRNGNLLWAKAFGGDQRELFHSIVPANNGGYILAGYVADTLLTYGYMLLLAKMDDNGTLLWQKAYGGQYDDRITAITKTKDGNYCGLAYSVVDTNVVYTAHDILFKFDEQGDMLWMKKSDHDAADGSDNIAETALGQIIYTGGNTTDIGIFVCDSMGNSCCNYNYTLPQHNLLFSEISEGIIDTIYKVYNDTFVQSGGGILIYDCIVTGINTNSKNYVNEIDVFPNPSQGMFTLLFQGNRVSGSVEVFNALGQKVYTGKTNASSNTEIDLAHAPRGIYLVKVMSDEHAYFKKVMIE